jgi:plastocyanin
MLAAVAACGGGGNPQPNEPDDPVLTSVVVTPDTATLFTVAPGTSVELRATGRDQDGGAFPGAGPAEFSSDPEAVATVAGDGTVSAVSAGVATITATMTAGGVTRSGTAEITVRVPPLAAAVQAPGFAFEPRVSDVAAGGTVTWTIGTITHEVLFESPDAPEDIPATSGTTVGRGFATPGVFVYHCLIHAGMSGSVRVH